MPCPASVARLQALIANRLADPFAWGVRDCCTWAADAVQAATGVDKLATVRGAYSDGATAWRHLRSLGGFTRAADALLSGRITALQARPGDVALLHRHACAGSGMALAVYYRGECVAQGAHGLVRLPAAAAAQWWRAQA